MDLDEALMSAEEAMEKAVTYLKSELRGVRTGRASTGLVEFIKVDYYGSPTDLREIAMISLAEATQILVKPYEASGIQEIIKAIHASGLGLNPMSEGKQIRISIPGLSGDRRKQLVASIRQMSEQAKVTIRNARRDGNKHIDQAGKDKTLHLSEDQVKETKEKVQDLVKNYEKKADDLLEAKTKEIQEV